MPDKYAPYNKVLNNFRSLDIDLAVSINDYLSLDLTRPYYLRQEAAYFMFNRLNYQSGKPSNGEFIKINIPNQIIPADAEIDISIIVYSPYSIKFRMPIVNGFNDIDLSESFVFVNGVSCEFNTVQTNGEIVSFLVTNPVVVFDPEPVINSFEIHATDGLTVRVYTYLEPELTFTYTDQQLGVTKTITATVTNG